MATFLILPFEVRFMIYEFLATYETFVQPLRGQLSKEGKPTWFHSDFLSTNRTIYDEYRKVLYSRKQFYFLDLINDELNYFLNLIGRHNAAYIRDITISLPLVDQQMNSNNGQMQRDDVEFLNTLQRECTGVRIIRIETYMQCYSFKYELDNNKPEDLLFSISWSDNRVREFSQLAEIRAGLPRGDPWTVLARRMRDHGWVVEDMEDWWCKPE